MLTLYQYIEKSDADQVQIKPVFLLSFPGAFDVDSTLDFDLDHIAGVRGLPPDVTGTADLLAVSGLGDGTVDIDMPGTSQSKM